MQHIVPVSRQLQMELRNGCCAEKQLQTARLAVQLPGRPGLSPRGVRSPKPLISFGAGQHSTLQSTAVPGSIGTGAGQSGKAGDQR